MPNIVVAEGNEQTSFSWGMLSFDGLLPHSAGFEGKKAQEAGATVQIPKVSDNRCTTLSSSSWMGVSVGIPGINLTFEGATVVVEGNSIA